MKTASLAWVLPALFPLSLAAQSFYGDPPDETHPWAVHDMNRPQPPVVTPGRPGTPQQPGKAPSDAVVLFDGTEASLEKWIADKKPEEPTKWVVQDGALQCVPGSGYIRSKEEFGDCQLHLEWAAPAKPEGSSQGRGNSGVFLMGKVEVQVLDNVDNPTYADGYAGSVYGVNPPMVNALRPPGEWQVYDILFRRPLFKDGKEVDPGRITVLLNGVVVQECTPLEGGGGHKGRSKSHPWPEKGPLKLQDHGNPVKFRNIWCRPLPPRAAEGGTEGALSIEATTAKRQEIASELRAKAANLQGNARMLKLMESLVYADDAAAKTESEAMLKSYIETIRGAEGQALEQMKGDIMRLHDALKFLTKFNRIPSDHPAVPELAAIIEKQGWNKKK